MELNDRRVSFSGAASVADLLAILQPDYVLVEEWTSRTARLSRYRSAHREPAELVVKVCHRWEGHHARTSFENAALLSTIGGPNARSVELLGWSAEPPAVVSEYVDGVDLAARLRTTGPEQPETGERWVAAVGELLGRIHGLRIPAEAVPRFSRVPIGGDPVLCAGDIAAYNFRFDQTGRLVYLEPPAWRRVVPAHRDLAWFVDSVDALMSPHPREWIRRLRQSFLTGYRTAVGERLRWTARDSLLLSLHRLRRKRERAARHRANRQAQRGPSTRSAARNAAGRPRRR